MVEEPGPKDRRKRRIERLLIGFFAIGFLMLIGVGIATYGVVRQAGERTDAVVHAYRVQVAIGNARQLIEQGENARRGYLLSGDTLAMRSWRGAAADLPVAMARLDMLLADPGQHQLFATLTRQLGVVHKQHLATNALVDAGRIDAAAALYRAQQSPRMFRPLRAAFAALQAAERDRIVARTIARQVGLKRYYALLGIAAALVVILLISSFGLVLRYMRDLDRSRVGLRRLADTLEDQVVERTGDLSRANEEIQRFAYIVSHDLRSPLVNVMGFTAELAAATGPLADLIDRVESEMPALLTDEARLAAREDLPEAIGFIRTSTQKMDRLINAILKLSREGRRVIAPEPIDLAALVEASVGAIRHIVDDRGVAVRVERPMPPLVADRLALDQILSNLIENATKYLQPGRPGSITVSARTAGARVIIAVADNGRGIDPRDHQRVFDLFRRSGTQDQPGEGIGLAHVRALAYRLGGTIDVESALGEGATFRVNLPASYQAPQDIA